MIPVADSERPRRPAPVVLVLLAACVAVFAYELRLPEPALERLVDRFALRPDRAAALAGQVRDAGPSLAGLWELARPFLTSLFLHGDFAHLAGNMLFLWVFGPAVEARFRALPFLLLYVGCGVAAGLVHSLVVAGDVVAIVTPSGAVERIERLDALPTVGASGAIAGVLGAYFLLHPRARVLAFLPPFFLFTVPSALFLGLWFVLQYLDARDPGAAASQIAHWAHVGGFVAGMVAAIFAMTLAPRRFVLGDARRGREHH